MASGSPTLVTLGASNLTRGFATVVNTARRVWGEPIDIFAALGHGRSYGMRSRVLFRELPGILECGLWRQLEASPRAGVRALVTDIGNDILYGAAPDTILSWVRECVTRLRALGAEITITDLPLHRIRRLTRAGFLLVRSVLFPRCQLDLAETLARCELLAAGVAGIARMENLKLVQLRPEWYGLDPIHLRLRWWAAAWRQILLGDSGVPTPPLQPASRRIGGLRLYLAAPQRQRRFGVERTSAQPAIQTQAGTRVWFY
jgi:hypothetical protein